MITKKLATLFAAGALLLGAQQASALTYSDADLVSSPIGAGIVGNFDLVSPDGTSSFTVAAPPYNTTTEHGGDTFSSAVGFTPGVETLIAGSALFWFRNAQGDTVTASMDVAQIFTSSSSGNTVILGGGINASVLATLNAAGNINYKVTSSDPTVVFDYAYLEAYTAVPDGGTTLMLLGTALSGLCLVGRRMRK